MASDRSGISEHLFGAADEDVHRMKLFNAANKVYTGKLLPPDSDEFTSDLNLFTFQAEIIKELAGNESLRDSGPLRRLPLRDRPNVLRVFHSCSAAGQDKAADVRPAPEDGGGGAPPRAHHGQKARRLLQALYGLTLDERGALRYQHRLLAPPRRRGRGHHSQQPGCDVQDKRPWRNKRSSAGNKQKRPPAHGPAAFLSVFRCGLCNAWRRISSGAGRSRERAKRAPGSIMYEGLLAMKE